MSEMAAWINELSDRIATGRPVMTAPVATPGETPAPTAPSETPAPTTPSETPAPTTPSETSAIPADLRGWLWNHISSSGELSGDLYDAHAQQILAEIQKFDPNARWVMKTAGGPAGEAGYWQPPTYVMDFDQSKLPTVGGPGGGRSIFETGFVPVGGDQRLANPDLVYNDPYYGPITMAQNVQQAKDPWWTIAAPIAVSMLAPWAAGGLAAAGIGGTAGLTAAATGSGLAPGASTWWSQLLAKAPSVAKQVAAGNFNPATFAAGVGANALGIPPEISQPVITAGSMLTAKPKVDPGYNPQNYNNAGSAKKPGSNESSLVANDFAADPYGFSKGTA